MKKSISRVWLAFLLLVASLPVAAQQKDEQEQKIVNRFDTILLRLGKVKTAQSKEVQKIAAAPESVPGLSGPKLSALKEQALTTGKEIENKKKFTCPTPIQGSRSIRTCWRFFPASRNPSPACPRLNRKSNKARTIIFLPALLKK